jgi:hypothetical protein
MFYHSDAQITKIDQNYQNETGREISKTKTAAPGGKLFLFGILKLKFKFFKMVPAPRAFEFRYSCFQCRAFFSIIRVLSVLRSLSVAHLFIMLLTAPIWM